MAKFNTKKEYIQPTEVNEMGEQAFKLQAKEELISTCMTTFLQGGYYEAESEETRRINDKLKEVDPLFAAKLAIYVRKNGNMRSVSHLIASSIAERVSGSEWGKRFYEKIIVRPDDMSEILSCYSVMNGMDLKNIRKIPNSMKKGFKKALEKLDAYQIDKYKMKRRSVSLIDLINIFKPKGNDKNKKAFEYIIKGKSLSTLSASKILEKELSKSGQNAFNEDEKLKLKREAICAVLENVNGMPIMNLLRNLRKIILYAPSKVDEACLQLCNEEKILNSKLLPFRFATAYGEIEKMVFHKNKSKGKIVFENEIVCENEFIKLKNKVLDAIEEALQISCKNIPKLEGNVCVLVDHSGSVRGDSWNKSRVSAFSQTTRAMIGNLFATMVAYVQDNVYIGLFGNKLIHAPIDRSKKMLDFNKESYDLGAQCGGATEQGIYDFFRNVVEAKKKIDNIIIFSDCQIGKNGSTQWYGSLHTERSETFQDLIKEFQKLNPLCNIVVVNINQTKGNSVFHKKQRILNIAGWSSNIFDILKTNLKGFDAMIEEIEKIEI